MFRDSFLTKWSCVLHYGVINIKCLILSFKYCFNMIAKINTNKNYLEFFKNILLIFLFIYLFIFYFFLCSKKSRDYVHYEMEFHFTKWSYIIFSSYIWFTDLLLVYPFSGADKTYLNYFRNTFKIVFCFVLLKKITGLCSLRNGILLYEMKS